MKKKGQIMVVCSNKICNTSYINHVTARVKITKSLYIVIDVNVYEPIDW